MFYGVIIVIMAIFGAIIGILTGMAMLNYTMIPLISMLRGWFYAERINNMLIEVRTDDFMLDFAVMLLNVVVLALL